MLKSVAERMKAVYVYIDRGFGLDPAGCFYDMDAAITEVELCVNRFPDYKVVLRLVRETDIEITAG